MTALLLNHLMNETGKKPFPYNVPVSRIVSYVFANDAP